VKALRPLMDSDSEETTKTVVADLHREAAELANLSFGDCLLFVVAELYTTRAQEFVGMKSSFLGVEGHMAAWKGKRLSIQNHAAAAGAGLRAAGAAMKSIKTVKEIAEKNQDGNADPMANMTAKQLKATQDSLPVFLEAMWHVSVLDIERTLTNVTHKLCRDHSVPEDERAKRAEALLKVGDIFMEEALNKGGSKDPKAKVKEMVALFAPSMTPGAAPGGGEGAGAEGGDAKKDSDEAARKEREEMAGKAYTVEELRGMSVKQLKAVVAAKGVRDVDVVEKEELVQVIYALNP